MAKANTPVATYDAIVIGTGQAGPPLARRLIDLPRLKRLMAQWPKDANEAEARRGEYRLALARGVHVGRFIRWVEGGNA